MIKFLKAKFKSNQLNSSKKGVTLVELIATIAILSILSTVSLGIIWISMNTFNQSATVSQGIQEVTSIIDMIHDKASVSSGIEITHSNYIITNSLDLNTIPALNGAKEGDLVLYKAKEGSENTLKMAIRGTTDWKELLVYDQNVLECNFELAETTLSIPKSNGNKDIMFNYEFIMKEHSRTYEGGLNINNMKSTTAGLTFASLDFEDPTALATDFIILIKS